MSTRSLRPLATAADQLAAPRDELWETTASREGIEKICRYFFPEPSISALRFTAFTILM
jgi:hypothetical protein